METYVWILLLIGYLCTVSGNKTNDIDDSITNHGKSNELNSDLKSAASSYYSGWPDPYGSNRAYEVTGHGILDKNYNVHDAYQNYQGYNRYDSTSGHRYRSEYEENSAHAIYPQYTNNIRHNPAESMAHSTLSGNGGYGGYGGNGGLGSYLGYKNPHYNGANHLGYGYYNKPGYSNIYYNGITPSLVTGYRGYSKK